MKALDAYGTGLADQYGQQYVSNLQTLTDTGQRAAGSLTGAGQAYANAVSSNNNAAATAAGNAAIANATITQQLCDSERCGTPLAADGEQQLRQPRERVQQRLYADRSLRCLTP